VRKDCGPGEDPGPGKPGAAPAGGASYAIAIDSGQRDAVEVANVGVRAEQDGPTFWFCSDLCRGRLEAGLIAMH
jgi:hypothetical protein